MLTLRVATGHIATGWLWLCRWVDGKNPDNPKNAVAWMSRVTLVEGDGPRNWECHSC